MLTMAALTWSGDQAGWAESTSAAVPAVTGEAMDVPEYVVPFQPLPLSDDSMLTPGAATSGFSQLSP